MAAIAPAASSAPAAAAVAHAQRAWFSPVARDAMQGYEEAHSTAVKAYQAFCTFTNSFSVLPEVSKETADSTRKKTTEYSQINSDSLVISRSVLDKLSNAIKQLSDPAVATLSLSKNRLIQVQDVFGKEKEFNGWIAAVQEDATALRQCEQTLSEAIKRYDEVATCTTQKLNAICYHQMSALGQLGISDMVPTFGFGSPTYYIREFNKPKAEAPKAVLPPAAANSAPGSAPANGAPAPAANVQAPAAAAPAPGPAQPAAAASVTSGTTPAAPATFTPVLRTPPAAAAAAPTPMTATPKEPEHKSVPAAGPGSQPAPGPKAHSKDEQKAQSAANKAGPGPVDETALIAGLDKLVAEIADKLTELETKALTVVLGKKPAQELKRYQTWLQSFTLPKKPSSDLRRAFQAAQDHLGALAEKLESAE